MSYFAQPWTEVEAYLAEKNALGAVREIVYRPHLPWPAGTPRSLVLSMNTAVELGSPRDASASFLLLMDAPSAPKQHNIRLIGPDLPESPGARLSFGKVVQIQSRGLNAENVAERCRELEEVRHSLQLEGYMLRAVLQYQREWSRVSRAALENGFSFRILGSTLIDAYRQFDYVEAVSILFVTASAEAIAPLSRIGHQTGRILSAMNKMAEEVTIDCAVCEYADICREVAALRALRRGRYKEMESRINGSA